MPETPGESGDRASWRDSAGDGGGGDWRRPEGVRSWRRPEDDENRPARTSRISWRKAFKSLAAATVTAGCIALAVWLLNLPGCVQTTVAPVVATFTDTTQVPPNLPVAGDLEALKSLDRRNGISTTLEVTGNDSKVLIVYLSALWVPSAEGDILVIDSRNPKLDDPASSKQNFKSLAKYLQGHIGDSPTQNTLVLLDLCQLQADWRIGVLENDLQQKIQETINTIAKGSEEPDSTDAKAGPTKRQLAIICSCSPGEHSWASPHLGNGQTAFGYSVRMALEGDADADRDHNKRISVFEFFRFVSSETNTWVQQNRSRAGQHPVLLTGDSSFDHVDQLDDKNAPLNFLILEITSPPKNDDKSSPGTLAGKSPSLKTDLDRLQKLWTSRNALQDESDTHRLPAFHHDPLGWRELTFRLRRAEQWIFWNNSREANKQLDLARDLLEDLEARSFSSVTGRFARENIIARLMDRLDPDRPFSLPEPREAGTVRQPENHLREVFEQNRDMLPQPADDRLAARAIKIRELAERATSGAFGTLPQVQATLVAADRARRKGEDLLLVGDKEAAASMQAAEEQFQQAMQIRSILFSALVLRNRLHSQLPGLADWAASHGGPKLDDRRKIIQDFADSLDNSQEWPSEDRVRQLDEKGQQQEEDLTGAAVHFRLLALFEQAQLLDQQLANCLAVPSGQQVPAVAGTPPSAESLKQLKELVADARQRLDNLSVTLDTEGKSCLGPANQAEGWRRIQDILRYTNLDALIRRQLVEKSITKSGRMQSGQSGGAQTKPQPPSYELGMWRGLWAIKVLSLGHGGSDGKSRSAKSREARMVHGDLWSTWRGVKDKNDTERPVTVRKLGARLRKASLAKRRTMELLADPEENPEENHSALAALLKADRIARSLPPSDAIVVRESGKNPTLALHRYQLAELLHAQGERYLEDFWQGWFETAAGECITAGESLDVAAFNQKFKDLATLRTKRAELAEQIKTGTLLKTTSPSPLRFGSRDSATVAVDFTSSTVAPPGLASLRLVLTPGDKKLLTLQAPSAHSLPINPSGKRSTPASFTLQRNASIKLTAVSRQSGCPGLTLTATPRLFYRGHQTNDEQLAISIDPCPPPVFRVNHTPLNSKTGEVFVGGKNKRQAIMFILDCSASMSEGIINKADINGRWKAAIEGLTQVINRLHGPASHTTLDIALMAFGHRVGDDGEQRKFLDFVKNELPPKVKKNFFEDYDVLRPFQPLDKAHHDKTLEFFKYLMPWGGTPSFAALNHAVEQLEKRGSGGIVVLITDGIDTDPKYADHARALKASLRKNPGVSLQVVLFGPTLDQLSADPALRKQTSDVDERIETLKDILEEDMGHELHEAAKAPELAKKLATAVKARPYYIRDPQSKGSSPPYQFSTKSPPPHHDVKRGRHIISYGSIDSSPFDIRGGERHVFILQGGTKFLYNEPEVRTQLTKPGGLYREASNGMKFICSDYHLAPMKTDKTDKTKRQSAEFILCLVGNKPQDIVSRPREILFDIVPTSEVGKPLGEQRGRTTRWEALSGKTTPTWKVTVDDWPPAETATIRAYWKQERASRVDPDKNSLRRWDQVQGEPGGQVFVPLPPLPEGARPTDNQMVHNINLKGTYRPGGTSGNSRGDRTIEIIITPTRKPAGGDDQKPAKRELNFHQHFGRQLPELVWENGTNPPDLEYSSQFTCEPGLEKLTYTFVLPRDLELNLEKLQVRVLSWTDRKEGAVQLVKPLVTKRLDSRRRFRPPAEGR